jgi:hypothetical protein
MATVANLKTNVSLLMSGGLGGKFCYMETAI